MTPTVSHLVIWFCWWARRYRRLGLEAVAGMFAGLVASGWQSRRENNTPELCDALADFCRRFASDTASRTRGGRAIAAEGVTEAWLGAQFVGYAIGDAVVGAPRAGDEHAGECRLNCPASNLLPALLRAGVWARIDAEPVEHSGEDLGWVNGLAAIVADEARDLWARAGNVERVTQDEWLQRWTPTTRTHSAVRMVAGLRSPESYPIELRECLCKHVELPTHDTVGSVCRALGCRCEGFVDAAQFASGGAL